MNKVLVITYYWPPHAGVGVQRWLKFVKYLPEFDWEPVIFTPENAAFDLEDPELVKEIPEHIEILKFPIWEPFQILDRLTGGKKKKDRQQGLVMEKAKRSWIDRLIVFLRGNLFIPDPRVFWVRPSVKFLKDLVESQNIDIIVTTGPPHSMHLIGLKLKQKTNIHWIADFRDPWSQWDLLDKLKVTGLIKRFHKKLENKVLTNADEVITVSQRLANDLQKLGGRPVEVIKNGVDVDAIEMDFSDTTTVNKFRISHIGLLNEMRDPQVFWEALIELIDEVPGLKNDLELNLAGIVSESILVKLKRSALVDCLSFKSYLPHNQVFDELKSSAILLVILNNTDNAKWIIPGKLYEYLIAKRRILLLGPENSDAGELLKGTGVGISAEFGDKKAIKMAIKQAYDAFLNDQLVVENTMINDFSRKTLTGKLAQKLNNLRNKSVLS